MHDTFIDVQIYFILSMNFFDRCKSSLGRWKWNRPWHKWTRRMSLVLKSFINNRFIIKTRNLSCDCLIGSTSPFLSRFTFSSTSQLISVIIPTLVIHHSFSLSLQAQNLPFQQILPTVDFFYLLDCLAITGLDRTYYAHHFIFSFTF